MRVAGNVGAMLNISSVRAVHRKTTPTFDLLREVVEKSAVGGGGRGWLAIETILSR